MIVIAAVCIVITAISALNIIPGISPKFSRMEKEIYGDDHQMKVVCIKAAIYILIIGCYTSCLIGAIKRNRFLLLPFIVLKCILIVAFVMGVGFTMYFGSLAHVFEENGILLGLAAILFLGHWLFVIFLFAVVKFYKDLSMESRTPPAFEEANIEMHQMYSKS